MRMKLKICLTYLTTIHLKGLYAEANYLKEDMLEDCEADRFPGSHK